MCWETSTLRVAIVTVTQAARNVWLSTPARLSDHQRLHASAPPAKLSVVVFTETQSLRFQPTVTEHFWAWSLSSPPIGIAVAVLQVLALIRAQLQIVNVVIRSVAVFVVNNFGWQEIASKMLRQNKTMLSGIASLICDRMALANIHANVATFIDHHSSSILPQLCIE